MTVSEGTHGLLEKLGDFTTNRERSASPQWGTGAWRLGAAIDFFLEPVHRHRAYPVVDEQQRLVSLVSRADILGWIGAKTPRTLPLAVAIADIATATASPDKTISTVVVRMMVRQAARMPIIDPATRRLLGIGSRGDVIKLRWREFAAETACQAHLTPWRPKPSRVAAEVVTR